MNENDYAREALESHMLGDNPTATLGMIARMYRSEGYDKRAIRRALEEHLLRADPDIILPFWSKSLERVVNDSDKRKPVEIDRIAITENELARIKMINGIQAQRVAFTLLCLAKYWDVRFDTNTHVVHTPHADVFALANIATSLERRCKIIRDLKESGLLSYRKYFTDLRVTVNYIEEGHIAMYITDLRNLGYQYMALSGGNYMECESCGKTIPRKTNNQKFCKECAEREHLLRSAEYMRKRRDTYLPS